MAQENVQLITNPYLNQLHVIKIRAKVKGEFFPIVNTGILIK